ncbi:thiamine diphosphokinase [Rhodobacteraceae bacterium CCMM004]|nr:thiamine diphosphokinase [Rhodobacteraceae bacterium CCMM004]
MMAVIVDAEAPITLLGGGAFDPADLAAALARGPRLVAVDGGADAALALGHRPEAVIGDFDSVSSAAQAALGPHRLHRVDEQESTDFEKCLARVSAPLVIGVGFLGARADHSLAAFNALVRWPHPCILLTAWDVVFHAGRGLRLDLAAGTRLSLFPMRPVTGVSEGLHWPIEGLHFAPDGRIGTSNRACGGPVRLSFDGPGMLAITPRAALDAVAAALMAG